MEKTPMLGKIEGKRRRGQQKMRRCHSITNSVDMNLSKLCKIVKDRQAWHVAVHGLQRAGHDLAIEKQQQLKVGRFMIPASDSEEILL